MKRYKHRIPNQLVYDKCTDFIWLDDLWTKSFQWKLLSQSKLLRAAMNY